MREKKDYLKDKIEHIDITKQEFDTKIAEITECLDTLFNSSNKIENEIKSQLSRLQFNEQ